jgi:hypothetical protein
LTIEVSSTRGCSFFSPSYPWPFTTGEILRMAVCQFCGNKFHRLQNGTKCGLCQLRLPGLSPPELQAINVSSIKKEILQLTQADLHSYPSFCRISLSVWHVALQPTCSRIQFAMDVLFTTVSHRPTGHGPRSLPV